MSNEGECCCDEEARRRAFDRVRKVLRELSESPMGRHARGVQRESLLLARSVLDFLIERLEEDDHEEEEDECRCEPEAPAE